MKIDIFVIMIVMAAFMLVLAVFAIVAMLKDKKLPVLNSEIDQSVEVILVPTVRCVMAGVALLFGGSLFLMFSSGIFSSDSDAFTALFFGMFLVIGLGFSFVGIRLLIRCKNLPQLEFDATSLRHRPYKWYSFSRYGHVNALSIYLSSEWTTLPYKEIRDVILSVSVIKGNYIQLVTKDNSRNYLIFIASNRAQMEEIYHKIKQRLA